jgi:hypothetical protein
MNQHPWAQKAAQAYHEHTAPNRIELQTVKEGNPMTAKDDAILDIETQFLGIMRKIELAYGRYFLNDDKVRAATLRRMHTNAAEGVTLCDQFRRAGEPDQRSAE